VASVAVAHALARPSLDTAELFDVDVQQLAGARALVSIRRFQRLEPAALSQPDPQEHRGHGRECHPEHLGNLGRGHPQAP
jgi:hypothetical protein